MNMKKLFLLALLALAACHDNTSINKYEIGDMVYIKPDSVKVYIFSEDGTHYWGSYYTEFGEKIIVFTEKQIY